LRHTIASIFNGEAQIEATGHDIKVLSLFFYRTSCRLRRRGGPSSEHVHRMFREEWQRSGKTSRCARAEFTVHSLFRRDQDWHLEGHVWPGKRWQKRSQEPTRKSFRTKSCCFVKSNPRAFVFSHSALREGWDNPNVFQICFLRHTKSEFERRQQIGRGLRLPVDQSGNANR
jgi:type III restriction enzyme